MKRIAIVDFGTNTFNLLVVEVHSIQPSITTPTSLLPVFTNKYPALLGKGGFRMAKLTNEALERSRLALSQIATDIAQHGVKQVFGFATSAVREAKNGSEFVLLAQKFGIQVEVLSGDQEAALICDGVRQSFDMGGDFHLVMDIGGGSTEFIIANRDEIVWKNSYLLGVARIKELFATTDPVSAEKIVEIETYLSKVLSDLFSELEKHSNITLIGSSGSFDTFFEMLHPQQYHEGLTHWQFDQPTFLGLLEKLIDSHYADRLKMKGLLEMRAEMIPLAALLTRFVLKNGNIKRVGVSTYSLKEGVLNYIQEKLWRKS